VEVSSFALATVITDDPKNVELVQRFFHEAFVKSINGMVVDKGNHHHQPEERGKPMAVKCAVSSSYEYPHENTNETYDLTLKEEGGVIDVLVEARTFQGARHGLETLSQLIGYNKMKKIHIAHREATVTNDHPAYPHRGVMVDTARHFVSVDVIKKVLDGMAAGKLNVFHWHATDAVSFPLRLPRAPLLARYGAYTPEQTYSPEDVRDIVDYAEVRGIQVIPEVDAPRHAANGWQFGPSEGLGKLALCVNELHPRCRGGVCGHLDPTNANVYGVLSDVYADLNDLFPSKSVHLGGDEVEFGCWRKDQGVTKWMTDRNLDPADDRDMKQLWSQFHVNQTRALDANFDGQKRLVAWTSTLTEDDLILQAFPPERSVIQIWYGKKEDKIAELINRGYKVVMSNSDELYLDCGFGYYVGEGNSWCDPYKQWRTLYQHDPKEIYRSFSNRQCRKSM